MTSPIWIYRGVSEWHAARRCAAFLSPLRSPLNGQFANNLMPIESQLMLRRGCQLAINRPMSSSSRWSNLLWKLASTIWEYNFQFAMVIVQYKLVSRAYIQSELSRPRDGITFNATHFCCARTSRVEQAASYTSSIDYNPGACEWIFRGLRQKFY